MDQLFKKVYYFYSKEYIEVCSLLPVQGYKKQPSLVHKLIKAYKLLDDTDIVKVIEPTKATKSELTEFHSSKYIKYLKKHNQLKSNKQKSIEYLSQDCQAFKGIYDYVKFVGGCSLEAASAIIENKCRIAVNFNGGRHHSTSDSASGFCYVNDINLALLKLCDFYNRILYVDIDAHHSDGVEEAFYYSKKVMCLSFHKYDYGFFPGTGKIDRIGEGKGKYYNINIPLKAGIEDTMFFSLFENVVENISKYYDPEVIVFQSGADSIVGDVLGGGFNLTPISFEKCLKQILNLNKPLLLLGGGGYNPINVAKTWTTLMAVCVNTKLDNDIPYHSRLDEYGPDFSLNISPEENIKNENLQENIDEMKTQIEYNLKKI